MGLRFFDGQELAVEEWSAFFELSLQVGPLIKELAAGFGNLGCEAGVRDFGFVEMVAAAARLGGKAGKKGGDGGNGAGMGAEARQLRMVAVAAGGALQNFLGEEGLAPGSNEAAGIEIAWVKGPEPHVRFWRRAAWGSQGHRARPRARGAAG